MTSWFVTATDTDAGKTHVSCALLMAALDAGHRVHGYKPIETGVKADYGPDAVRLSDAGKHQPSCSYMFTPPIAPSLAAEQAKQRIEISRIAQKATALEQTNDFLLTEGAGGLLAPINDTETIATLALALKRPLLIVARDELGTINHTLLTLTAATAIHLNVIAVLLNQSSGESRHLDNQRVIQQHTITPVLTFPHCQDELEQRSAGRKLLTNLLALQDSQTT